LLLLILSGSLISCKKYLDAKPDKSLVVPSTISDLQALLDNTFTFNETSPSWDVTSSDNYYMETSDYNARPIIHRKAYIWEDYQNNDYANDWASIYKVVYNANVVLQQIGKIKQNSQNQEMWNNIK